MDEIRIFLQENNDLDKFMQTYAQIKFSDGIVGRLTELKNSPYDMMYLWTNKLDIYELGW